MTSKEYDKDLSNNEKYPQDANGGDEVKFNRYAKDATGQYFYPRDKDGNEFYVDTLGLIREDGKPRLPHYSSGQPRYDTDGNNDEIYLMDGSMPVIGKSEDGEEHYAKKANGDEIYPPGGHYAKTAVGSEKYALTSKSETIFPLDGKQNEMYITKVILDHPNTFPTRYAKDVNSNEIYPKILTADDFTSDYILNDTYAKTSTGAPFYPKDPYNNEFYISYLDAAGQPKKAADMLAGTRYAVTHDSKIILPCIGDKPGKVDTIQPPIPDKEIIGELIREGTVAFDYITTLEYPNMQKPDAMEYKYQDLKSGQTIIASQGSPKPTAKVNPFPKNVSALVNAPSTKWEVDVFSGSQSQKRRRHVPTIVPGVNPGTQSTGQLPPPQVNPNPGTQSTGQLPPPQVNPNPGANPGTQSTGQLPPPQVNPNPGANPGTQSTGQLPPPPVNPNPGTQSTGQLPPPQVNPNPGTQSTGQLPPPQVNPNPGANPGTQSAGQLPPPQVVVNLNSGTAGPRSSAYTATPTSAQKQPCQSFLHAWYFWVMVIVSLIVQYFALWWFYIRDRRTLSVR